MKHLVSLNRLCFFIAAIIVQWSGALATQPYGGGCDKCSCTGEDGALHDNIRALPVL